MGLPFFFDNSTDRADVICIPYVFTIYLIGKL